MRVRVEPDVELEVEVVGSGPELVWLHGLTGSLEDGRPVVERLSDRFRVLHYSTRGHGRSTPLTDRGRYGYARIARDLSTVLDEVGFTRPLLVGGSHGANTILRHEAEHPGRARGMLLIAPGGNALARPRRLQFALLRLAMWRGARKGMDGLIELCTGFAPDDPRADPHLVAAMRTHDLGSLKVAMRHIADQQVVDPAALPRFDVPTHVIGWDGDPVIHPIATARRIAELIPDATFAEIERVEGLSAAQVADVAASNIHTWADSVVART
ncbi:MAG: putative hydrolase or acyltransferase of alpha/beta superfamily [Frankiales bacterium]|nr:putative hydrolase or acyltransferase of alpha/beta superfamily [Frankiales bacterium]